MVAAQNIGHVLGYIGGNADFVRCLGVLGKEYIALFQAKSFAFNWSGSSRHELHPCPDATMVKDVGVVTKLNGDFTFNCLLIDPTKGYVRYIAKRTIFQPSGTWVFPVFFACMVIN